MKKTNLGILGGGQLGCMLCMAAKKLDVYTIVWSDDPMSPAKEFSDEFILSNYNDTDDVSEIRVTVHRLQGSHLVWAGWLMVVIGSALASLPRRVTESSEDE